MSQRLRHIVTKGVTALVCGVTAVSAAAPAAEAATAPSAAAHLTGTLADGATWIADVPDNWNGTLLLFSHGYNAPTASDAPSDATRTELLTEGYAMVGSSYDPDGSWWALDSAERDQFATIGAFSAAAGQQPERTLSVGLSMGGLVNAQIARDGAGLVDGALGLCGLVAGGVDLGNYQYDAEYTLASLLLPGEQVKLTGFTGMADGYISAQRLDAAVTAAQATPQGRARIALAAAYLNLPDWAPAQDPPGTDDAADQEAQQYAWLAQGVLDFYMTGRYSVEQSAGGNASWNAGVDYAALLHDSEHAAEVRTLYSEAGLDLHADLTALTQRADLHADPAAVAHLQVTSTAGQRLEVPLLDLHTTSDQLVPVQQESAFAARVRSAGDSAMLRQAYVARQGHCNFTAAEIVAGVHAIDQRVTTGSWGTLATPGALQRSAEELGLDGAAFVPYQPSRLVVGRRSLD